MKCQNYVLSLYIHFFVIFHGCLSINHFILVPEIEKQFLLGLEDPPPARAR